MTNSNDPNRLRREFGGWTGLFVVVASMVGIGILFTSGYTIHATGSHRVLLALWAVGGLLALTGALTVAELATAMPRVGGDYIYVRESFGPALAFVYGWSELIFGFAAPSALIALTAAQYLFGPFRTTLARLPLGLGSEEFFGPAVGSVMIGLFTWSHCRGQRNSTRVQVSTTLFKVLTLLGLALLGLALGKGDWRNFGVGRSMADQSPVVLAGSLAWILYGYSGWNAAVYLAGEIRDAPRLLPRCLIGGCISVTILYLLINLAYAFALDPRVIVGMQESEVGPVASLAAKQLFGEEVSLSVSILIGLGILASLSALLLIGPRVCYAMACDGLFPGYAGSLHPVHGTPVAATLTQAALSIGFCWTGPFKELFNYTAAGLALLSGLVIVCIFVLRRRPDFEPTFRVPFYPLTPLIYIVVTLWIVTYMLTDENTRIPSLLCCVSILAGFPVYWILRPRFRSP